MSVPNERPLFFPLNPESMAVCAHDPSEKVRFRVEPRPETRVILNLLRERYPSPFFLSNKGNDLLGRPYYRGGVYSFWGIMPSPADDGSPR